MKILKKEILKYFDVLNEAYEYENQIVTEELVKADECYNLKVGGDGGWDHMKNTVTVKDANGNYYRVSTNDPRYISGELIHNTKNLVCVYDAKNPNKYFMVDKNDPRYLAGEFKSTMTGKVAVKDKDGNKFIVDKTDKRYLNKELIPVTTGHLLTKDKDGNKFFISVDDPRYKSGELIPYQTGKTHTEETKQKISKANVENHLGELNSNYGNKWIHNIDLKQSKCVSQNELDEYINNGWKIGRVLNFDSLIKKQQRIIKKQQRVIKKEKTKKEFIDNIRLIYNDYKKFGIQKAMKIHNYTKTYVNLIGLFKKHIPEYTPNVCNRWKNKK